MRLFSFFADQTIAIILFSLLTPVLSSAQTEKPQVQIGVIAPLTGGLAERGEDISRMIEIIEPAVNNSNCKYHYKFVLGDGKCGAGNAAVTLANKFIYVDKIKFLITGCSGETLQAGPIAQRMGVVAFAVLSTHQDVKKLGSYVFRTYVDIERGIATFARHMTEKSGKIALVTEENAFTFGIKNLLERYLQGQIAYSDDFAYGTRDFNTLLIKVKASGVNGAYFNAASEGTLAALVNQSRALGLGFQIYSYDMPEAASFIKLTGKNSEGLEFIGSPVVEESSAAFKKTLNAFMRKHPGGASHQFLLRTFYDAADLIIKGVEAVGPNPQRVRKFIGDYHGLGALGQISFDQNGDVANINYALRKIAAGKVSLVGQLTDR